MDLIVTHQAADFDALASLVAAKKLYPGSKLMIPGSPEKAVGQFLSFCGDVIKIEKEKECNISNVTRLIIVDTRLASRIGKASQLLLKKIPILVYDHHPPAAQDIKATAGKSERLGATTTLLVSYLAKKKIDISPIEATIMALGIYEDTGALTYLSTTKKDIDAVSFLFSKGANLKIISSYLNRRLNPAQTSILIRFLNSAKSYNFIDKRVIIAAISSNKYIQDLALLTHKLRDTEGCDAIFCLVELPDKIQMVARSDCVDIDVGAAAVKLGGGGHNLASSGIIRDLTLKQVEERILELLSRQVKAEVSLAERIVSREPDRVEGEIVKPLLKKDLAKKLKKTLPQHTLGILEITGRIADKDNIQAFAVGGFVRDLILGVKNLDVDIVIEGDIRKFAKKLARELNGALVLHKKFKTATIVMNDKSKVDVATSRTERYHKPAALPEVKASRIREDLQRRDFTINTMAVKLNRREFGELLDFFDAQRDLKRGRIRVLHKMSFVEDPTRIFRAVRFESRYNFEIDKYTENLIKTAVSDDMFTKVSGERLREEIVLILKEPRPLKALKRMAELHELRFIHPVINFNHKLLRGLERSEEILVWYRITFARKHIESWLVYFLALIDQLDLKRTEELLKRFPFRRKEQDIIRATKKMDTLVFLALSKRKAMRPSQIYRLLSHLSKETILAIMAKAPRLIVRRRVSDYLTKFLHVKIKIKGEDLKKEGFKPGPDFSRILEKVLYARLDGHLKTRSDELRFVRRLKKPKSTVT
ncbi:MAG: DHHA1 domain-containing protein [Candidatus Omnitrophota bacterium]|nr:DHHA1 domain-containing protein [Candidatus Omnitrophota bacterium]